VDARKETQALLDERDAEAEALRAELTAARAHAETEVPKVSRAWRLRGETEPVA
jgi:hypothetical protein